MSFSVFLTTYICFLSFYTKNVLKNIERIAVFYTLYLVGSNIFISPLILLSDNRLFQTTRYIRQYLSFVKYTVRIKNCINFQYINLFIYPQFIPCLLSPMYQILYTIYMYYYSPLYQIISTLIKN